MPKRDEKKKIIEEQLEEDSGVIGWQDLSSDPPTVYSNHAQVLLTPYDFTLRFGQLTFGGPDKVQAKELFRVYMSPPHFKALANLLMRQVALYEARFGELLDISKLAEAQPAEPEPTPDAPTKNQ